jgi:hypothetical protein
VTRDFRWLLLGQTTSQFGAQVSGVAIPLLASDLVRAGLLVSIPVAAAFGVLSLVQLMVVSLLAGFARVFFDYAITSVTLRQRVVPPELLGRVNATMRFLLMGLFPLGALLGGVLGTAFGARTTLLIAGGMIAVSWLPVYRAAIEVGGSHSRGGSRWRSGA